jgi:hypothetical protein
MKNYSRQLDRFIESTLFANSFFRRSDARTWVSYYQDGNGLIHSNSFNYSIIGCKPVTVDEFKKAIEKDAETMVSYIN